MTCHSITWTGPDGNPQSTSYKHKADHRDGTSGKSQWKISEGDERVSFTAAMAGNWIRGSWAWGVHVPAGSATALGVDRDHRTSVFIARFDRHLPGEWHGYPVNHQQTQQRPPVAVLNQWLASNFLAKAKVRKIVKGQPCRI